MVTKVKTLCGWWVMLLLSLATLAAPNGDLRLVEAVKQGDKKAVGLLLNTNGDVDASEADGATPLAWAVHWDDMETADLLIRAGAHVNKANEYGVTPLSLACTNRNAPMVEMLLKAGADPNTALISGETVLMTCAHTGAVDAVKFLLAYGANVNASETWRGQTSLMWAVAERHSDVASTLIKHGAEVHVRSKGGFTPLLFAAQQGDVDCARLLLAAGSHVNDAAPDGTSPLLLAAASGHEALSIFLVGRGANVNATDGRGYTALHYAASGRNLLGLAKALLEHGADPNSQLSKGDVGATPFYLAATAGNLSAMRTLANSGANPLVRTKQNNTALMAAAGVGQFDARTDAQNEGALEAAKLAIELGVDVNAVGENGWTALHGAAYTGSDAIIRLLVDQGAKMEVKDKFGQTPLSIAEAVITTGLGDNSDVRPRQWRDSTVNLLLKLGATPVETSGVQRVGSMAVRPER